MNFDDILNSSNQERKSYEAKTFDKEEWAKKKIRKEQSYMN